MPNPPEFVDVSFAATLVEVPVELLGLPAAGELLGVAGGEEDEGTEGGGDANVLFGAELVVGGEAD